MIPASEKLTRSEIEKVLVGADKTALSVVDQRLNVVEVPKIAFHCFLYCVCIFCTFLLLTIVILYKFKVLQID